MEVPHLRPWHDTAEPQVLQWQVRVEDVVPGSEGLGTMSGGEKEEEVAGEFDAMVGVGVAEGKVGGDEEMGDVGGVMTEVGVVKLASVRMWCSLQRFVSQQI